MISTGQSFQFLISTRSTQQNKPKIFIPWLHRDALTTSKLQPALTNQSSEEPQLTPTFFCSNFPVISRAAHPKLARSVSHTHSIITHSFKLGCNKNLSAPRGFSLCAKPVTNYSHPYQVTKSVISSTTKQTNKAAKGKDEKEGKQQ